MKLLVTGAAGFIGSHLCLRLLKQGDEVIAVDDLSLGQEKFLKPCFDFKSFSFKKMTLLDFTGVKEICKNVDRVWHLAANSDIASGGQATDIDLKIGTLATYNILEAMRLNGVKDFVFSSTSAVYGEADVKPTPENYGPLLPISFYGASKLACEALATAFAHNDHMKVWIFRFANIVGSHTTHGAIHDFIKKLKKNPKELEILGDGRQAKSYLHIDDCLDGMFCGIKNSQNDISLYNLASQGTFSVDQIADSVIEAMKLSAKKKFSGGTQGWRGDVAQTHLDGSRLQKLGFAPKMDSAQAVVQSIMDIISDGDMGISS